ncbi:MAG: lipid A ABC transporter ATP-binding protein/permease MsbA [Gammaproteobacteria bacterium]|nr:MAG: lipid A ABC transporter ATP-binding protein/permease MsbA [Gammaproteobacteria bacterium]
MSKPVPVPGSLQLYRRLLSYVWPYKWIFAITIIGMVITAATEPAKAALLKPLLDGGFINKDPETILWLPFAIVGVFLVGGFGRFSSVLAMAWIGRRVIFDIRNHMFSHMLRLSTSYYDQNSSGVLMAKVIYDVEQIATAATKALFIIVKDSLTIIGLFAWMLFINWKLTLAFTIIAPVLTAFVRMMSRRFRKTSRGIQKSIGLISAVTQEATGGHRIVKAFNAQEIEEENFSIVNEKNRRQATRKAAFAAASIPVMEILAAIAMALVIYYALKQTADGVLTAGEAVSYFAAMTMLMNPAKRLTKVNETIQTGLAAAQSVFDLLDIATESDNGTRTIEKVKGDVQYHNVSYRYSGTEGLALDRLTFSIAPGETVALVGSSGSGKTTTANLLARFYDIDDGEILLDGMNIQELTLSNLRDQIALVTQETMLFNDTVRNNIAYGAHGKIDETRLQHAAKAAHIVEFVDRLENGFDAMVGEKGVRLSGGQRQRIAIARALYKNAPILILDEATSALDSESERYVQEAMQELMKDRTTLVIAHRLSTIENADKIIVLSEGKVAEMGTHKELLAKKGAYANLYHKTFDTET